MKFPTAVNILTKFFVVDSDIFKSLPKETVVGWALKVKSSRNDYKLSQPEHAFLVGELRTF